MVMGQSGCTGSLTGLLAHAPRHDRVCRAMRQARVAPRTGDGPPRDVP